MEELDFFTERTILKIGNMLNQARGLDLKNKDITVTQSETLLYYCAHPGGNIQDLCEHLQISHQAARKLVEKLKEKNYLEAKPSKSDARSSCIVLTESGVALCDVLHQNGETAGKKLLFGFTYQEKTMLYSILLRMENNINREKMNCDKKDTWR